MLWELERGLFPIKSNHNTWVSAQVLGPSGEGGLTGL